MTLKTREQKEETRKEWKHCTIKYGHETWIHRLSTLRINGACAEGTSYLSQDATQSLLQPLEDNGYLTSERALQNYGVTKCLLHYLTKQLTNPLIVNCRQKAESILRS